MPSRTVRPWTRPARPPRQSRAAHAGVGRHRGALAGLHVLVVGADASPHLTGFAGFSSAVTDLVVARRGLVEQLTPGAGDPGMPGMPGAEPTSIDLVIAVTPGQGAAAAAALADRHDVPLLAIAQASSLPPRPAGGTVGEKLAARLDRALAARADRWAATSASAVEQLVGAGVAPERIDRLPYWSALPEDARPPDRTALRDAFGWPADAFVVTCPVGAELAEMPVLLAAAEELAERGSPARLIMIGRGGRLRKLREGAGLAGEFIFEVTGSQYPATFAAADMALLTAGGPEGPNPTDGALAGRIATCLETGTPMMATAGGPMPAELAAVEDACVAIRAETPGRLADALETLADAGPARALLAASTRQHARVMLDPAAAGDALEAAVTAAMAARAEPRIT